MHAAGQTRVEAPNRAHNIDALELIPAVFLEDGSVLYGVFIGARRAVGIARIGVPRRRRVRMIVGDLAFANDYVMGKNAANGLMKTAADGFVGDGEIGPRTRPAGMQLLE